MRKGATRRRCINLFIWNYLNYAIPDEVPAGPSVPGTAHRACAESAGSLHAALAAALALPANACSETKSSLARVYGPPLASQLAGKCCVGWPHCFSESDLLVATK